MSNFDFQEQDQPAGPFASPQQSTGFISPEQRRESGLGAFVMTMVILDIVFCLLKGVFAFLAWLVIQAGQVPEILVSTAYFELGSNAGIFIVGLLANSLILARQRVGVLLGWLLVFVTLVNIVVAIWQIYLQVQVMNDQTEIMGALVGGGFIFVLRLALLSAYIAALVSASKKMPLEIDMRDTF